MKRMISKGYYVLCYDQQMKLTDEIGPIKYEMSAFLEMKSRQRTGKYKHVEVAEKVIMK
jgi:hypothetical protein